MEILEQIKARLHTYADPKDAIFLQKFFKTGKGQYGAGDKFIGVRVPATRKIAREFRDVPLQIPIALLKSKIHEQRLLALIMLVERYKRADETTQKNIYDLYLANTRNINNWDLVDISADKIVGSYLSTRSRSVLKTLAKSESLWERRIAIMSTFHFIRNKQFSDTFTLAKILLCDREDLIHKAVGWMLREVGKRDIGEEEKFLNMHYQKMPRTMLRYAIEKFPEPRRKQYLEGRV